MASSMIYLDNASTTKPYPDVIKHMQNVLETQFANPSSTHLLGRDAAELLSRARSSILDALGVNGNLYFTSGATEANNWAIQAAVHKKRHQGKHIIATAIEHDSVLAPLKQLESDGYRLTLIHPATLLSDLKDALCEDTVLVAAMLTNNETGAILPIAEMVQLVRERSQALFFTDAVQAFCKIPFSPAQLGVDFLSVSAHKLHGPRGAGALWTKSDLSISPFLRGGGQENGLRSGTEALHNIAGFAKAVTLGQAHLIEKTTHFNALQAYLRKTLPNTLPEVVFLPQGAPHIVSLSLPNYKSEVLMNFLDSKGVFVSHASACKRGGRSHVLTAMGLAPKIADGTLRISFSYETSIQELDIFIKTLAEAKNTLFPIL